MGETDLAALRVLLEELDEHARKVLEVTHAPERCLDDVVWAGADVDRFRVAWRAFRPHVDGLHPALAPEQQASL